MRHHAKVGQDDLIFPSAHARALFFQRNKGKEVIIQPDEAPTAEMRRFFEGCIVPVVFYAHPHSGWKDFAEARECLKVQFLPIKRVKPLAGAREIVIPISTASLSKERFRAFVETVIRWIQENELAPLDAIDSENYKAWRDSGLEPGAIYPPLMRMKELYDKEKAERELPPWRKTSGTR